MQFSSSHNLFWLVLLGLIAWGCSSDNSAEKKQPERVEHLDPYSAPLYPAKAEAEAKDFTVELVNGKSFTLSEQQGKVVLLNIWATWCAPCRVETPELVDLYAEYRVQGLLVLGVSIDEQGLSVVKPSMEKYDVKYRSVIGECSI